MTRALHEHLRTGGNLGPTIVQLRIEPTPESPADPRWNWCDTGGPIDAPETMPAGSVVDTGATNWCGRSVITQARAMRCT